MTWRVIRAIFALLVIMTLAVGISRLVGQLRAENIIIYSKKDSQNILNLRLADPVTNVVYALEIPVVDNPQGGHISDDGCQIVEQSPANTTVLNAQNYSLKDYPFLTDSIYFSIVKHYAVQTNIDKEQHKFSGTVLDMSAGTLRHWETNIPGYSISTPGYLDERYVRILASDENQFNAAPAILDTVTGQIKRVSVLQDFQETSLAWWPISTPPAPFVFSGIPVHDVVLNGQLPESAVVIKAQNPVNPARYMYVYRWFWEMDKLEKTPIIIDINLPYFVSTDGTYLQVFDINRIHIVNLATGEYQTIQFDKPFGTIASSPGKNYLLVYFGSIEELQIVDVQHGQILNWSAAARPRGDVLQWLSENSMVITGEDTLYIMEWDDTTVQIKQTYRRVFSDTGVRVCAAQG